MSHLFWPTTAIDSFFLPTDLLKCQLEAFQKAFFLWKPGRTLEWANAVGFVDLEVHFDNIMVPVQCDNDEASILILSCEKQAEISLHELMSITGFTKERALKALGLWVTKGLIQRTCSNNFLVPSTYDPDNSASSFVDYELVDWEVEPKVLPNGPSKSNDIFERLMPLIMGMLANFGSLSVGRIQNSLGLLASDYIMKEHDLKAFLDSKVTEGILQQTSDLTYSAKK